MKSQRGRGYYLLLKSEHVIALSCTHGSLLTVWKLRHERRATMSLFVCSPLMISLSLLSGAPRWQTRPEPPQVLILCASVCVCIHASVWLNENEMPRLLCMCVCTLPPVWTSVLMSLDFISDERLFDCSFG